MVENERKDFCTTCRKNTEYFLQKQNIVKVIKDKEYNFCITSAFCNECGEEVSVPGLIDQNIREVDEQYRKFEDIVSIKDIEQLMKIYKIGKAPLSLALGFGEITITRYLAGQIPSKEYSDIIRKALSSPEYMRIKLNENKDRISKSTYNKSMSAVVQMKNLFSVSDKMLTVIAYLFECLEEITPLMLQKLLYFIQGISFALNRRPMFPENCQAWIHGPVYPEVYNIFKDFKYNPIDDARFAIFKGSEMKLTEDEINVINLVVNTFGDYSGKVLERITHNESPWKTAREGYGDEIPSIQQITVQSIEEYYIKNNKIYDFSSVAGIKKYINEMK